MVARIEAGGRFATICPCGLSRRLPQGDRDRTRQEEHSMPRERSNRREFLTMATAAAASGILLPPQAIAAPQSQTTGASTMPTSAQQIFKPEFRFGLGGVPLGNEFEVVTDGDAMKTLEASWGAGVRYVDVSPWYGLGLAERRYGMFLHNKPRDSY